VLHTLWLDIEKRQKFATESIMLRVQKTGRLLAISDSLLIINQYLVWS
jgi:hypothetical protein